MTPKQKTLVRENSPVGVPPSGGSLARASALVRGLKATKNFRLKPVLRQDLDYLPPSITAPLRRAFFVWHSKSVVIASASAKKDPG